MSKSAMRHRKVGIRKNLQQVSHEQLSKAVSSKRKVFRVKDYKGIVVFLYGD